MVLIVKLEPAPPLAVMVGLTPLMVSTFAAVPLFVRVQVVGVLTSTSPKVMLPIVRGVSRKIVLGTETSRVEKSARDPAPSAITPPAQLIGSLQVPLALPKFSVVQVPLAASAHCIAAPTRTRSEMPPVRGLMRGRRFWARTERKRRVGEGSVGMGEMCGVQGC